VSAIIICRIVEEGRLQGLPLPPVIGILRDAAQASHGPR